jgi:hypothetical protein
LKQEDAEVQPDCLAAVKGLGNHAKSAIPDLARPLKGDDLARELPVALSLVDIDPQDKRVTASALPVLVAALKPGAVSSFSSMARLSSIDQLAAEKGIESKVLDALAAVGAPSADALFKALDDAQGRGGDKSIHRKALLQAFVKLGRKAHSEENLEKLKFWTYPSKEIYPDVRQAAERAIIALKYR